MKVNIDIHKQIKYNVLNVPCHRLNKRKISILLYYNGLDVSLFVIHGSETI